MFSGTTIILKYRSPSNLFVTIPYIFPTVISKITMLLTSMYFKLLAIEKLYHRYRNILRPKLSAFYNAHTWDNLYLL